MVDANRNDTEVQERLTLEAVSSNSLIAGEHVHRYGLAAALCAGLRVVDLACGSGYGSAILAESAQSVVGVDNDTATIDTARATIGREADVSFEVADAVEFLRRGLSRAHDAIVCLEGLEHFADLDGAVDALSELTQNGMKAVISVPNSRTFAEKNEFHLTDFGYDEAMRLAHRLAGVTVLYQFLAEGSLIQTAEPELLDSEGVLDRRGEPQYANHFIVCANLDDRLEWSFPRARMQLAVAPAYNRHMLELERANARLEEGIRGWVDRAEELELEVDRLRHRLLILDTPRHVAVERVRDAFMRSRVLYGFVRRVWAWMHSR